MGKSANKRKSERRVAAQVNILRMGEVTLSSLHAFPPTIGPRVVEAFSYFIEDDEQQGMRVVVDLASQGFNFFDFTIALTDFTAVGNADPLAWAWHTCSGASLQGMVRFCLRRNLYPLFFATLPDELELTEEGSLLYRLGTEIFTTLAEHLPKKVLEDLVALVEDTPRASAILKHVVAKRFACEESEVVGDASRQASPAPSKKPRAGRL